MVIYVGWRTLENRGGGSCKICNINQYFWVDIIKRIIQATLVTDMVIRLMHSKFHLEKLKGSDELVEDLIDIFKNQRFFLLFSQKSAVGSYIEPCEDSV